MEGRLARKDPRLAVPAGCQFQSRSDPHCHVQDTPDKADVTAMAEEAFEELAAPVPRWARPKIMASGLAAAVRGTGSLAALAVQIEKAVHGFWPEYSDRAARYHPSRSLRIEREQWLRCTPLKDMH